MDYLDASQLPTLAERLNYAMKQRGLVQDSLAARAGCSQTAVQKLSSGKNKTGKSKFLPAIARALDVDIDWLELGKVPSTKTGEASNVYRLRPKDGGPVLLDELSPWDDSTPLDDDEVALPIYKEVELASGHGRSSVQITPAIRMV